MLAPILKNAPATTPVSLAEAKAQLQLSTSDTTWDALVGNLILAATSYLDGWSGILGRCLISQTWECRFECFETEFDLPFPNCSAATVEYYDSTGTKQTFSSSNYQIVEEAGHACICLYTSSTIPAVSAIREDAVIITATCGYGDATAVPPAIKHAILLLVGHWFANREAVVVGAAPVELPYSVTALVAPFRVVGV